MNYSHILKSTIITTSLALGNYHSNAIEVSNIEDFHKATSNDAVNIVFDLKGFSYNSFNHSFIDKELMLETIVFKNLPTFDFEGHENNYLPDKPTDILLENTFSYNVFSNAPNLESITLPHTIMGSLERILFFDKYFFDNLPEKCIVNLFYPDCYSPSMLASLIPISELKLRLLKCKYRQFVHINFKGTIKASSSILGWKAPQNENDNSI